MTEFECKECNRKFATEDALNTHNQMKHAKPVKPPMFSAGAKRKIKFFSIALIVLGLMVGAFILLPTAGSSLPPTNMKGHIEVWPSSQILQNPIAINQFKHILEHADNTEESPGIIISYNCVDFECSGDLIQKLEAFTIDDSRVYVAPFKNLDSKIVLTRLGRQQVLANYDESIIQGFIG